MSTHSFLCTCNACNSETSSASDEIATHASENSRRDFLKRFTVSVAMAGSGLPLAASALNSVDSERKSKEMFDNAAVKKGKAAIVTILHTADIHAQLLTHDEFFIENGTPIYKKRGGYAVLQTMIKELRQQNPGNTILVDGGDCFQGSGVAAMSKGKALIPLMNHLNYDVMLPGNWEVIYGKEMLMEGMFAYSANKVCANMYHDTDDQNNGALIFPPYFVKQLGGMKIGFIGYNDPLTGKRQSPAYSEGITFTHPEANVSKYIQTLRNYEKCDVVILLTHMGLAQQVGLADMPFIKGTDYILGADTHERVRQPLQGKFARVTEPGAFGSFVSKLDIVIEKGKVKEHSYNLLDVDPGKYHEDPEMKILVKKVRDPYEKKIDRIIGTTKTPLVRYYVIETPMDNFITDAIMWKFKPDIALSNGFRFCPPLVPDASGQAEITVDYLWSMMPDDNEAKQGNVTGRQLWDYFETELDNAFAKDPAMRFGGWLVRFKGMQLNFTIGKEKGERINWIKVKDEPLDLNRIYTVAACERDGDPITTLCRIENVKEFKTQGVTLHGAIEEYLAEHSPISPKLEGRAIATDAPATLLTQLTGVGYEFR